MKQSLRILHLEDNPADAELIHEKLAAEGVECEVTLVDTREGFVSALEQDGFDIILADYKLPSFDGISALNIANEKCPEVPFMFISGTIGEDTAVEALKSGATDYIIKDRLSRLASAVRRALKEAEERIEHKRAEEALRLSEERYRSLFENLLEGFAYCRMLYEGGQPQDFIYLDINDAFEKLTGLKNVVGRKVTEVIPGIREADPGLFEIYGRVALTGKPERFEMYVEALSTWFHISVYSPEKEYFVAVFDVITERKRAEEELVRLYQQLKEEAEISGTLLTMVETLNTNLDERELIRNVVTLAPRYLKFDRIGIFLYDESVRGFVFSGGHGFSPAEESILLSRNFRAGDFPAMDKAVRGETLVIENALETDLLDRELVDAFGVRGAVIVPISARGKVIGGIYVDYKSMGPIGKKDVSFLKGLADGIAIALQNSRLYRESVEGLMELSNKIETIKAMARLDKEILSSIDKSTILKTATALINRVIPAERAAVVLREGDNMRVVSEWGMGTFLDKTYSFKCSHFESLDRNRASQYFTDLVGPDCSYHKDLGAAGIKSSLQIPLVTKGGVAGFLDIGSVHYGRLMPENLSTAESIASQIAVALENARLYEELQQLLINTITSLASAIDAKSSWTKGHSERVTQYALRIGEELGLRTDELEHLRLSGLLHDVGKIGTYDILLDKPEKLTDEEFALVKRHPQKGAEILNPIKQLGDIIPGVLYHHERYDGRGYPHGLKGEEIPLQARILCVADSFDSMTADRPYRHSPGKDYAISEFKRCSGTQFDPKVVEVFLKILSV